jgi:hypothetical protein
MEDLSYAAMALYCQIRDDYQAEPDYLREYLAKGFPETAYEDAIDELLTAGWIDSRPKEAEAVREPRGVVFSRRSEYQIRTD